MVVKIKPDFSKIKLSHENPEEFFKSQWQKSSKSWIFLTYRWILSGFFIFVLTYSLIVDKFPIEYHFIYLTNIGLAIVTLFATYSAVLVTLYHFNAIGEVTEDSISYKLHWLLSNISVVLAFLITIVYWATLYNWNSGILTLVDFLIHAANSIFMFIEICVVQHPMNILHFVYLIGCLLIYLIFSIVYYYLGGTDALNNKYIYDILDWSKPGSAAITCVLVAILLVFLHLFAVFIQFLRKKIHKRISGKNSLEITRV